eukprot:gene18805-biopygen21983
MRRRGPPGTRACSWGNEPTGRAGGATDKRPDGAAPAVRSVSRARGSIRGPMLRCRGQPPRGAVTLSGNHSCVMRPSGRRKDDHLPALQRCVCARGSAPTYDPVSGGAAIGCNDVTKASGAQGAWAESAQLLACQAERHMTELLVQGSGIQVPECRRDGTLVRSC